MIQKEDFDSIRRTISGNVAALEAFQNYLKYNGYEVILTASHLKRGEYFRTMMPKLRKSQRKKIPRSPKRVKLMPRKEPS